jgi:cobyrinic acid a,c-diamide synthase
MALDPCLVNIPRVVIAGATSGVGKTTICLAIMDSLRKKGFKVQPFKVGPDFIDPSYHEVVTKRSSRNLDVWMMKESGVMECFATACQDANLAVIEGVMGLFDGMSGKDNFASTAHVASILKSPVILVVDASKAARSVAAIILGFTQFDKRVRIAGVILNNVASERHAGYLMEAVSSSVRVPVLGMVKRERNSEMEERHLGLVPARELEQDKRKRLVRTAGKIAEQIDIDRVLGAFGKNPLDFVNRPRASRKPVTKIAVALDESFNFYYQDNLSALRRAGARLEFFSPVSNSQLPEKIDGIILGGGFPEVLADRLEKNKLMSKSIRRAAADSMPIYAECGGLMYLSRSISGYGGSSRKIKMLSVVDADTVMTGRLTLNYTEATCDGPLLGKALLRGHEFHYSELRDIASDTAFAYQLSKGKGISGGRDGISFNERGLAAYTHLHFGGGDLAQNLVKACTAYSRA